MTNAHTVQRPVVRTLVAALALATSAGALTGLVYVEVGRADEVGSEDGRSPRAAHDGEALGAVDASPKRGLLAETTPIGGVDVRRATGTQIGGVVVHRLAETTRIGGVVVHRADANDAPDTHAADVVPLVIVPDFSGERLASARRKARELGLRLVVRDAYGRRRSREFSIERVRSQKTEPGTTVPPGSTIDVRARVDYAMGY